MKKIISLLAVVLLSLSVIFVAVNAANNTPFTDVPEDTWYTDYVNYCYTENLMKGSSDTTFSPNMTVDRSQIVQVLANMSDFAKDDYAGKTSFPDVKANDWFAPAVEWAKANGVASGTDKGTFNPTSPLTREQLAQFIYNYAGFVGMSTQVGGNMVTEFNDATSVSSWANQAINWCIAEGILTGSNNNIMPKKTATRAELAVIIERFDKMTNEETTSDLANDITVSGAFTDDMMLQRDEKCSVWGWAPESENGKSVVVEINGKTATAVVENGEWKAVFAETFPYSTESTTITVKGGNNTITFNNVLFGDVYYVIGQSNVYYSIKNLTTDLANKGLSNQYSVEFDHSKNLRFFRNSNQYHNTNTGDRAPGTTTLYEDAEVPVGWQTVAEVEHAYKTVYTNTLADNYIFSALGYITAYNMSEETDVPIGVIEIDASGFPLIAFAPNELADKWGTEVVDEATGVHYWAITDFTIEDGSTYPILTSNLLTSRMAYNQQIYPLINFSIAGIWWYQGESDWTTTEEQLNGENRSTFANQFTELMEYYRSVMGNDDFPVYMIEFPSCYQGSSPNQAYISTGSVRTEQGKIPTMLDNFYLVSSSDFFTDVYWENNIHPYIKHLQANRLYKMVMANGNYDSEYDINYVSGPTLKSVEYTNEEKNEIVITLNYVGDGLINHDEEGVGVWGLEILVNGEWIEYNNVVIGKDTLTITYNGVIDGVRYHRATDSSFPVWATLSNSEGIPVSAFVKYFKK